MAFKYQKNEDQIVTLTMDMANRSVNVINKEYLFSLQRNIKKIENEKDLKGVIITSSKASFLAGADLELIFKQEDSQECFQLVEENKAVMRRLEKLSIPVVAIINGSCLGGGLEFALCCNYRVTLNNPKIKFGFPEITFGLLPGGGGLTRVPRMIGIKDSIPLFLQGKQFDPLKALEIGLIDQIANTNIEMFKIAEKWILENQSSKQPWDLDGFIFPGGNTQNPEINSFMKDTLANTIKKTGGNYPAPEAIINVMIEGSHLDFETASKIESRYFASLATNRTSKNMINTFWFQMNKINAGTSRPLNVEPTSLSKIGVLGSGLMGHGIAYVSALAGMDVVMIDSNQQNAEIGLSKIRDILEKKSKNSNFNKNQVENTLAKITATSNYKDLSGCELIIEAVFEDQDLKGKVTKKAEKEINADGFFASNTSTIPISELAKNYSRPNNFIGLHFFSPVHKMKLVEIIKGKKTSPETLAKAFDYVLQINKIPIVVNDSRGFYTTRVFERYTCEGMALLEEGVSAQDIESAGRKAGYPIGPLAILDEINISLAAHIRTQNKKRQPSNKEDLSVEPWDRVMKFMVSDIKRTGRSNSGGFYEYPKNKKKYLWPQLTEHFPLSKNKISEIDIIDRYYFSQAIESILCYEENVITAVADANVGSILGWGFPSFKGGTLQFVNDYGLEPFKNRAEELSKRYGKRFTPPKILIKMIQEQTIF